MQELSTDSSLVHQIVFFGSCSGAAWSLIPGFLSEILLPVGQGMTVVAAGVITGVIISLLLAFPLMKTSWFVGACLGLLSLPIGAFTFGVAISLVQCLLFYVSGTAYRFVEPRFAPLSTGVDYASGSLIPYLAAWLFPCAVFTTLYFQRILKMGSSQRGRKSFQVF